MSHVTDALRLHLEVDLVAPVERAFGAFVDPAKLRQWWGPNGFTVAYLEFDVRAGARYRIGMQPPEGDVFHLDGTFRVVDAPRRLVFTFAWAEPDPDDQETTVCVTFAAVGGRTHLVVDQAPFKTTSRRELHRVGWSNTLARLERFLDGER